MKQRFEIYLGKEELQLVELLKKIPDLRSQVWQ
mgnify:CR=1 FL=1